MTTRRMLEPTTRWSLLLAIGSLVAGMAPAGTLEPPGPPAPTMVTLQSIYDAVTPVPGLPGSLEAPGPPAPTMNTAQAIYEKLTSNRFIDRGNGTVKDTVTGLIWLKDADCLGSSATFSGAWSKVRQLGQGTADGITCGLTDGSGTGSWRLPSLGCFPGCRNATDFPLAGGEFTTIFGPGCSSGPLNAAGTGCMSEGDPFVGVHDTFYWSNSAYPYDWNWPVVLNPSTGYVTVSPVNGFRVWAVRSGP